MYLDRVAGQQHLHHTQTRATTTTITTTCTATTTATTTTATCLSMQHIPVPALRWLGGVTVSKLDFTINQKLANSTPGWVANQVVTTWMRDCRQTGKQSWYITNYQGQLSLSSLRGR